jgi:hypothetical protein
LIVSSFFGYALAQRKTLHPISSSALIECRPTCSPHPGIY